MDRFFDKTEVSIWEVLDFPNTFKAEPPLMRYEVLCTSDNGEPMIGTIVTRDTLENYCRDHNLILSVFLSKSFAQEGDETNLI